MATFQSLDNRSPLYFNSLDFRTDVFFSQDRTTSRSSSLSVRGLPPLPRWLCVHLRRTSSRCHLNTVSGWKIRRTLLICRDDCPVFAFSLMANTANDSFSALDTRSGLSSLSVLLELIVQLAFHHRQLAAQQQDLRALVRIRLAPEDNQLQQY